MARLLHGRPLAEKVTQPQKTTGHEQYFPLQSYRVGPYAAMDTVYYVQTKTSQEADAPATSQLIKRGNELHAPDPHVLIPKTAILFVEDLRDDSPIAQYMDQQR